jgi:hypothetical protein
MKKMHVEFDVTVDEKYDDQEIDDWIKYSLGDSGTISAENKLLKDIGSMEPDLGSVEIEWS